MLWAFLKVKKKRGDCSLLSCIIIMLGVKTMKKVGTKGCITKCALHMKLVILKAKFLFRFIPGYAYSTKFNSAKLNIHAALRDSSIRNKNILNLTYIQYLVMDHLIAFLNETISKMVWKIKTLVDVLIQLFRCAVEHLEFNGSL